MPREVKQQVDTRQVYQPISAPQAQQVVARPTDQLALPIQDPELLGLVRGLATLNPALQDYVITSSQVDANRDMKAGAADRLQGKEMDKKGSDWYRHSFMQSDGDVKGDIDGNDVTTAYLTGFDKDTGNIDDFFREHHKKQTEGITDPSYLEGYNRSIAPHYQKIRDAHLKYQQEAVVQKVESNATYKLDKAFQARIDAGELPTVDDIEAFRKDVVGNFNGTVSNTRVNDLVFHAIDKIGAQGNPDVYNVLFEKKPDGTPGMAFIPEWKPKVDAAVSRAQNVMLSKSKAEDAGARTQREEAQNTGMFEVVRLAETDRDAARALFQKKVSEGLITNAKDYLSWKKMVEDAGNREASAGMMLTEVDIQKKIYQGKHVTLNHIADADLTPQQKNSLMGVLHRVQGERRRDAAEGNTAQYTALKTPYYKEGDEYIEANLKIGQNPMDFDKSEYEYNLGQIATVKRAFQDAALTVKDPKELRNISYKLVTEAQQRLKANRENRDALPGGGRIRFTSITALQDARARGEVGDDEARVHLAYLKAQQRNTAANVAR